MWKRILAMMLVGTMTFTMMDLSALAAESAPEPMVADEKESEPEPAVAEENVTEPLPATVETGEFIWQLDGQVLTITGSGAMPDYDDATATPWYVDDVTRQSITKIVLIGDITQIGNHAFWQYKNVTEVVLPDTVERIGRYAFAECKKLALNGLPAEIATIDQFAFYQCKLADDFVIPDTVTYLGNYAFCDSGIKHLTVHAKALQIENTPFGGYNSSLQTTDWYWEGSVTVTEQSYNTTSVCGDRNAARDFILHISSAQLATDWEDNLEVAWRKLSEDVTNVSVTDPENLTKLGAYCFYGFYYLRNFEIPETLQEVGRQAFTSCISLTSELVFTSEMNLNPYFVVNCEKASVVFKISGEKASIDYTDPYARPWNGYGMSSVFTKVIIEEGTEHLGRNCLYEFHNMTELVLPDSLKSIGMNAFGGCSGLTSVILPKNLERIDTVVEGNSAEEGYFTFNNGNYKLDNIYVAEGNTHFSSVEGVLFNADGTELLYYPSNRTTTTYTIPDGVTSIGDYAFCKSKNLVTIEMPDTVTYIGNQAFAECCGLTTMNLSAELEEIGYYRVFFHCENWNLTELPASLKKIGTSAFEYCDNVRITEIPENVTYIGDYSFCHTGLQNLVIPDTVTYIGTDVFDQCDELEQVEVFVGDELKINGPYYFASANLNLKYSVKAHVTGAQVSGTYDSEEDHPWYDLRYAATEIVVDQPETATNLCEKCFYQFDELTSFVVPEGLSEIKADAFSGCYNLEYVLIPASVETIADSVFYIRKTVLKGYCNTAAETYAKNKGMTFESLNYVAAESMHLENGQSSVSMPKGKTGNCEELFPVVISPENASYQKVTWTSSDSSIISITNDQLTAREIGTAKLTGTNQDGLSVEVDVRVYPKLSSLRFKSIRLDLNAGESIEYAAIPSPENSEEVITYTSSNPTVATVTDQGKISALKSGWTEITAEGELGIKDFVLVVVKQPAETIVLDHSELTMIFGGEKVTLHATLSPADTTDSVTWFSSDSEVASVNINGVVTAKKAGTATITATASSGVSVECLVRVVIPATDITVNPTHMTLAKGTNYQLEPVVSPANTTEEILYRSSNPNVAAVDEEGNVSAIATGNATITIQAGQQTATCDITVIIPAESIFAEGFTIGLGKTRKLPVTVTPADTTDTVAYTSSDLSIVSIDEAGIVTANGIGEATVIAKISEAIKTEVTIRVVPLKPATGLMIREKEVTIQKDSEETVQLTPVLDPMDSTDPVSEIVWESDNEAVVKVLDGILIPVAGGTTTIRAVLGELTAECVVHVLEKVKEIRPESTSLSMYHGSKLKLSYTLLPVTATDIIRFESSSTNVVEVDANGQITAVAVGTATITIKASGGAKATLQIKVLPRKPDGIQLNMTSATIYRKETLALCATLEPSYAVAGITWTSSNEKVATVKNGVVTAVAAGTTTITVTSDNGKKATCNVTVKAPEYNIQFNGNGASAGTMAAMKNCIYGDSYTLSANSFTKKYYTFNGWNTKIDGTGTAYKNQEKVKNLTKTEGKTITLYAQWKPTEYTITYKLNSGKNSSKNPAVYTYETGKITLANPSRTGYQFEGWYRDSKFKKCVKTIEKGSSGNIVLYAKWSIINYSIKYNLNGGKISGKNPTKYNVATPTITLKKPTRTGYTFQGWYSNSKMTKACPKIVKGTTGAKTLYAKWKANTYTIKFKANETSFDKTMSSLNCTYGKSYKLPSVPWKSDSIGFAGWNTKANGTGKTYANKASIKNLTSKNKGSITLYAQWKLKEKPQVTVTKKSTSSNKISWKRVNAAIKYEVYRSTSSGGKYKKLTTTTDTSFVDTKATTKTKYYYKVRALGTSDGGSKMYSDYSKTMSIVTAEAPDFTARIVTDNGWTNVIHVSISNKGKKDIVVEGLLGMYTFKKGWSATSGPVWPEYHVYRGDRLFGAAKIKEMSGKDVTIKAGETGSAYISLKQKDLVNDAGHASLIVTYDGVKYMVDIYNSGEVFYLEY